MNTNKTAVLEPVRKEQGQLVYRLTLPSGKAMERRVAMTSDGFQEINKWAAQFGRFRHN